MAVNWLPTEVGTRPARTADADPPREGHLIFGRARVVIYASSSLPAMLRLPANALIQGRDVMELLALAAGADQKTTDALEAWVDEATARPRPPAAAWVAVTTTDERTVQMKLSLISEGYWVATLTDATNEGDAEEEIFTHAFRDHLTGIGNRALFEKDLDTRLGRLAAGQAESTTVLLLDLDRFKLVNDNLGHGIGDLLLRLVSERVQDSLRELDVLSRLGGDEFGIVLAPATGKEAASFLAIRIIDLIERPYLIDGHVIHVGASIGIAIAPLDGESRDELLKNADLALYHSKGAGRGVSHFFQPAMAEKALRRRSLELDLRKALMLRQFELHYQPEINVETLAVMGLEGLLRWRHPQRGIVLPEEFMPLAEEIGLAVSIGDWILKTSCREALRWPDLVRITVNVSPLQFEMGELASSVERTLLATGLPGSRLEIEVTENVLLRNGDAVLTTMMALRAMGVRVSLGSFGTGLASLSQLVNYPFDAIKIDSSLLGMGPEDTKQRAIVRAISTLGKSLGITTMAEGVEDAEQLALVRSDGCDSVQGFYYGKALPSSELAPLLSSYLPRRPTAALSGASA